MEDITASEIENPKPNAAVQRCCEAFFRAMANPKRGDMDWETKAKAGEAYRRAMPFLSGQAGVSGFLDCVTHGIILGVFDAHETTRLLNAVKVAQNHVRKPTGTAAAATADPVGPQ